MRNAFFWRLSGRRRRRRKRSKELRHHLQDGLFQTVRGVKIGANHGEKLFPLLTGTQSAQILLLQIGFERLKRDVEQIRKHRSTMRLITYSIIHWC